MLNSLQVKGLIERNPATSTYGLTVKVKSLSHGYDQEEWTGEHARPLLLELGERINWPVSLDTVMGNTVIIRENTDSVSSLVFQVIKGGYRAPLLSCASGWVLLTQFSQSERAAVLEANKASRDPHISMLAGQPSYVEQTLSEIKEQGFCCRSKPADRETEISVPVYLKGQRRLAALSMRYFSTAMRQDKAVETYVPLLQETSQKISDRYLTRGAP
jgi:IclR family mhp operon transcriptional activator